MARCAQPRSNDVRYDRIDLRHYRIDLQHYGIEVRCYLNEVQHAGMKPLRSVGSAVTFFVAPESFTCRAR
jgi:hypothetical protein